MNEKDLKKLSRQNLVDLIISQNSRCENLQKRIEILEQHLRNREIPEKEPGSLIDASREILRIFTEAQQEAEQYLDVVNKFNLEKQAEINIIDAECARKIAENDSRCAVREKKAEEYVTSVSEKVQRLFSQYRSLEESMQNVLLDVSSMEQFL